MNADDIITLSMTHDLFNKHIDSGYGICKSCHMITHKNKIDSQSTNSLMYHRYLEDIYKKVPDQFIEIVLAIIKMKLSVNIASIVQNTVLNPSEEKRLIRIEEEILKQNGDEVYRYVESVEVFSPIQLFKDKILQTGSPRSAYYFVMYIQNTPCLETFEKVKEDPSIEQFYIEYARRSHSKAFEKVCNQYSAKQSKLK